MGNTGTRSLFLNVRLPSGELMAEQVSEKTTNKVMYETLKNIFEYNFILVDDATGTVIAENSETLNPAISTINIIRTAESRKRTESVRFPEEAPAASVASRSGMIAIPYKCRLLNGTVVTSGILDFPENGVSGTEVHAYMDKVARSIDAVVLHIGYADSTANQLIYVENRPGQILPVHEFNYFHVVVQRVDDSLAGGRKRRHMGY